MIAPSLSKLSTHAWLGRCADEWLWGCMLSRPTYKFNLHNIEIWSQPKKGKSSCRSLYALFEILSRSVRCPNWSTVSFDCFTPCPVTEIIRTIKMGQNFVQTGHFWCHCWCTSAGSGRTDVTHRFHVSLGDSHFLFFEISDICHSQNYQYLRGKLRSKGCKSDMCIVYQKNALHVIHANQLLL